MSTIADSPHFVWVRGLRGPQAQKWSDLDLTYASRKAAIIVYYPITDREFRLFTIEELEKLYPAPKLEWA